MPDSYTIDSSLVNKLIAAIIAAILAIGGYMALWAINDSAWKARMDERWGSVLSVMTQYESSIDKLEDDYQDHVKMPCHDVACVRLQELKEAKKELLRRNGH